MRSRSSRARQDRATDRQIPVPHPSSTRVREKIAQVTEIKGPYDLYSTGAHVV